jgi:hypothetical protein
LPAFRCTLSLIIGRGAAKAMHGISTVTGSAYQAMRLTLETDENIAASAVMRRMGIVWLVSGERE